jgi:hypothetical protein
VNVSWDAGNIGDGDYLAALQQVEMGLVLLACRALISLDSPSQ